MNRGAGIFYSCPSRRLQRCTVKIAYSKNTPTRSWAAHGKYLQREHAQEKHARGLGFNEKSSTMDIAKQLADWQGAGDSHFFKMILSPEQAHRVDLKAHVTNLMAVMQNDVNTALEWVAIDHHNTEHPHVRLLIRGIDAKGKSLTLDKQYISRGIRQRSQELLTRELGLRTSQDLSSTIKPPEIKLMHDANKKISNSIGMHYDR